MTSRDISDADSNARVSRLAIPPVAPSCAAELIAHLQPTSFADAMHHILRRYGGEIRAFLRARTNSRTSMEDVFSVFTEDVWKGLPQYRAQGQLRGWIYALARNALSRHVRLKQRWRSRHVSIDLDQLQHEIRRSAPAQLGQLTQFGPLLTCLSDDDRRLLEQRLVSSKSWRDIAIEQGAETALEIDRLSARLRKRYQLLVRALRERAAASGDAT